MSKGKFWVFLITFVISALAFIVGLALAYDPKKESDVSSDKGAKWCMFMGYCLLVAAFWAVMFESLPE